METKQLMSTCDTCGLLFQSCFFGQADCLGCKTRSVKQQEINSELYSTYVDVSSCIEDIRDLSEDAITLLNCARLTSKKRGLLLQLIERIRTRSHNGIPDDGDFEIEL